MSLFDKRHFCVLCRNYKSASSMHKVKGEIGICNHCNDKLYALSDHCFEGPGDVKAVFSPFLYESPVKDAVKEYKFSGQRLYGELFGEIMADMVLSADALNNCELIIPVPLYPTRLDERGYNQSEILACEISNKTGIPIMTDALFRVKETQKQSTLKGRDRVENVRNAFFAWSDAVVGKSILLVDDICTMGETIKACSAALKDGGAGDIFAATLCRVVHKGKIKK